MNKMSDPVQLWAPRIVKKKNSQEKMTTTKIKINMERFWGKKIGGI